MPILDAHKDAILALLMQAEGMAYLIADREFNIWFASPETAAYGIGAQGALLPAPMAVRYTAIEAAATDTRASMFARLNEATTLPAHS